MVLLARTSVGVACGRLWTLDYGGACTEKTVAYRKMNAAVGDKYTYELVKLFEQEGRKNGRYTYTIALLQGLGRAGLWRVGPRQVFHNDSSCNVFLRFVHKIVICTRVTMLHP